ncbi:low temperature requirement protein A [Rugosimonospora africana]|uniref:Membrane protein n=1 Tax=Rugosimonospora africana TaxID=556532 RepID=A0A8J3QK77_9ACTN|nr:low temperature requirement protein A [Rugosimonospora africana]GIH12494.1 membrane protein [Rugosimonospora africana]
MTTSRAPGLLHGPEDQQRAAFLELFFDLAFVFALFQLSHGLLQRLHWSGALQTLILLLALCWIWGSTTWITDRFDSQRSAIQLLVIVTLFGSVVLAAVLPAAFGKYGLVFAGLYVAIQLGRNVFLVFALRGHQLQRIFTWALLWWGASAVPWIAGALARGIGREALWALAVIIDFTSYWLGFPRPGARRVPAWEPPGGSQHLAERYRQLFIIALGELILVSGLALSRRGLALDRIAALLVSIATTALLWRIYIYRSGEVLSAALAAVPEPARLARTVGYTHIAMIAGIVVTAVADELVITHPFGQTAPAWSAVILGGPALFLIGRAGFEHTVFARVSRDRPIGLLALATLTPVTLVLPPMLASTAVTAVLAGIAIADAARARRHPAEPPSPPARGPT